MYHGRHSKTRLGFISRIRYPVKALFAALSDGTIAVQLYRDGTAYDGGPMRMYGDTFSAHGGHVACTTFMDRLTIAEIQSVYKQLWNAHDPKSMVHTELLAEFRRYATRRGVRFWHYRFKPLFSVVAGRKLALPDSGNGFPGLAVFERVKG
jgi:hypothetical protein